MTCLSISQLLSEPLNRLSDRMNRTIRVHAAKCDSCAAYLADVRMLEKSVGAWRTQPGDESLRDRIQSAIELAVTNRVIGACRPVVKQGRTWAGLAAAAILTTAVLLRLFFPVGPSARAVAQEMAAAIDQIRNVHYTMWSLEYKSGEGASALDHKFQTLQIVEQEWYQDHSWRKEGVWGSRLIVAYPDYPTRHADGTIGTYYRYDSEQHRVISMGESGLQLSDFSLSGLLGPLYDSNPDVEVIGHERNDGDAITVLALTGVGDYRGERCVCYIDDDTNLPERIDMQTASPVDGGWTTTARDTLEFNQNLPASVFDPSTLKDEGWSLKAAESPEPSAQPAQ
jgi:hypothetical protein